MDFRHSSDSLSGLGISGNIWFRRFAVTYISFPEKKIKIKPNLNCNNPFLIDMVPNRYIQRHWISFQEFENLTKKQTSFFSAQSYGQYLTMYHICWTSDVGGFLPGFVQVCSNKNITKIYVQQVSMIEKYLSTD